MKYLLIILFVSTTYWSNASDFKLEGFSETVFIVNNMEKAKHFYTQVAGYEVRSLAPVDKELNKLWQLPSSADVRQILLSNKGENRGYIRLIKIEGVAQQQIRSNTQSWDTGGIFDVNVRVADMDRKFRQLQNLGWQSVSDPVGFTFGPFEVKEWITRGHDGVSFALIERIKPTLEGWPNLKEFSRVFNSTQVVKDIDVSLAFYQDVLGFQIYLKHKGASESAGPNVLGLPYNLTTQIERSVYILHPQKKNEGSVEILQFHGANGRDVSHLARPPNIGIATLRFPTKNLAKLEKTLVKNNIEVVSKAQLQIPPYGIVNVMAILTPDDTWLEFYEKHHQKN